MIEKPKEEVPELRVLFWFDFSHSTEEGRSNLVFKITPGYNSFHCSKILSLEVFVFAVYWDRY